MPFHYIHSLDPWPSNYLAMATYMSAFTYVCVTVMLLISKLSQISFRYIVLANRPVTARTQLSPNVVEEHSSLSVFLVSKWPIADLPGQVTSGFEVFLRNTCKP